MAKKIAPPTNIVAVSVNQNALTQLKTKVVTSRQWKRLNKFAKSADFAKAYTAVALLTLAVTTLAWSYWGARLHMSNADELVDPYLFKDHATFSGAQFPGAHTFILKWPLFLVVKLFGFTVAAYIITTMALSVATVTALVYGLYKLERRPLYFGMLCLALASVLLLVPAQPYAGALLPVNFAMLATRNLEYVLFIACLVGYAKSLRLRSKWFGLATLGLSVLLASDKLFLALSLGGALAMLVGYALAQSWKLVSLAARWLTGTLIAVALASGFLKVLNLLHATHVVSDSSVNPYSFVATAKDLVLGSYYSLANIATNFGANPGYDATQPKQVIVGAARHLLSLAALSYVLNILLLLVVLVAIWKCLNASLRLRTSKAVERQLGGRLVVMLIASSLVATGVFIATKHYYAVDARYLTMWLFTGFAALCLFLKKRKLEPALLVSVGGLLLLGTLLSLPAMFGAFHVSQAINLDYDQRNTHVASALANHHVAVLVGDYWRVLPIQNMAKNVTVSPLGDCGQPRNTLTSTAWNRSLKHRAFAYLVSLDKAQTDFPSCSIDQITGIYGRPNSSLLVAGSFEDPKELLLFYDKGQQPKSTTAISLDRAVGTVAPIDIASVPNTSCFSPTVMNIVAHQDDDLLFLSPDLLHSLQAGNCVRTVYLTAGDSGHGEYYWTSRQQGAEAAYSAMLGKSDVWVQRIIKLGPARYITIASPRTNPRVSLVFMNLPDGNLRGNGFKSSHYQSLAKLRDAGVESLNSVDGQSNFTSPELIQALSTIMHLYQPAEIRTQASVQGEQFSDHSDHIATREFVEKARQQYLDEQYKGAVSTPISYYIGYPIREHPNNVFGGDLSDKEAAFLTYAKFDGGVCSSMESCNETATYGSYLTRQYKQDP